MNASTKAGHWIAGLCVFAVWMACGSSAPAINIVLHYQSGDEPSWDLGGTNLQRCMQAAELYWEDIIQDSWTLDIDYEWADLDDAENWLGLHTSKGTASWAGDRREDEALIQFDSVHLGSNRAWFDDPDPLVHQEFGMQQHICADFTVAEVNNWYYSNPSDLVEVNYWGDALTAPDPNANAEAQTSTDLFSVCLHEIGHALGLTQSVAEDDVSASNPYYRFPGDMVDHDISGAESWSSVNLFHLEANNALMVPSTPLARRRLPSATDVMCMAKASDWTNIRKWSIRIGLLM